MFVSRDGSRIRNECCFCSQTRLSHRGVRGKVLQRKVGTKVDRCGVPLRVIPNAPMRQIVLASVCCCVNSWLSLGFPCPLPVTLVAIGVFFWLRQAGSVSIHVSVFGLHSPPWNFDGFWPIVSIFHPCHLLPCPFSSAFFSSKRVPFFHKSPWPFSAIFLDRFEHLDSEWQWVL